MTDKQIVVYQFIVDHINQNGHSPTIREIAEGTGKSVSVTHGKVERLREAGYIGWSTDKVRTIKVLR